MQFFLIALSAILLISCGGSDNGADSGTTTTQEDPCVDEYYAELTRCTDASCEGCVDWECLFCGGECRSSAEAVYNACCSHNDCTTVMVSGSVTTEDDSSLEGVELSLTGAAEATHYTDRDGHFRIKGTNSGPGTLTPSKPGYCFEPESYTFDLSPTDAPDHSSYDYKARKNCDKGTHPTSNPKRSGGPEDRN